MCIEAIRGLAHREGGLAQLIRALAFAAASFVASGAAAQPSSPAVKSAPAKLTISGSSILAPLVTDIARRFEKRHAGVRIEIRAGGSGRGLAEVRSGASDIGMLSRALFDGERELYAFPMARDGVAVVVHRDNPVKNITSIQLTELLVGDIVNWRDLGGRDAPVQLAMGKGQGSFELVLEALKLRREQIGDHVIPTRSADKLKFTASNPDGVTLASIGDAERNVNAGLPVKLLAYNDVPASARSIQRRAYMLSRPLTLVTRDIPQGLQKAFVDYALSSEVVDLQVKYGFVPYQE